MSANYGLYVAKESGIHGLHPFTKLAYLCLCLVAGWVIPGVIAPYGAFLLGIVPVAVGARILPEILRGSVKSVLPFAISLFLVQGFFWPQGTVLQQIGPLSLKEEGLLFAIRGTGRILVAVSSFLLFTYTTRPNELTLALSQVGVPSRINYVILSALQIIPHFQDKATTIIDAQRSRGLETEGNLIVRARALLPLIIPLLLSSIIDIEERAIALEVRAFGRPGPKTSLLVLRDTTWQRVLRALLLLAALGVIVWRLYLALAPRLLS